MSSPLSRLLIALGLLLAALGLLLAALPVPASANPAEHPDASALVPWFMPAEFDSPRLSPGGTHLAFILCDGKHYAIGIFDIAARKLSVASNSGKMRPVGLWWKGPRRLLTHLVSEDGRSALHSAFDIDGGNPERIHHLTQSAGRIIDALPDDPDHVLRIHGGVLTSTTQSLTVRPGEVFRFNLRNGKTTTVAGNLPSVHMWHLDRGLNVRAAFRRLSDGARIFNWRNSATGPWQAVNFAPTEPGYRPIGFDADPRYLWVWDFQRSPATVLSRFDTQTGRTEPGLAPTDGLEPTVVMVLGNSREPVAAVYPQSVPVRIEALNASWRPAIERLQKAFAGYTPSIVDRIEGGNLWIVHATSSRFPGGYYLFDSQSGETTAIASTHNPALKEELFVAAIPVAVPSRHGITIHGRVWLPKGVSNPPVIVYCPSALPATPVIDAFNPYTQAYVSRGYAVAQFDGRGTMGYGREFEILLQGPPAGVLQEDMEDGVKGLAAQGLVDAKRAALFGYGLGGALALSAAENSAVFRAVVSLNAPVEVEQHDLLSFSEDFSLLVVAHRLGWRNSIRMAEALSPIDVAPRLKLPALHLMDEARWHPGKFSDDAKRLQRAVRDNPQASVGLAYSWFEGFTPPETHARDRASAVLRIVDFYNNALSPDR